MKKIVQYCGTGRRKKSIAKVILKKGTGKIFVNDKENNVFFKKKDKIWKEPLVVTGSEKDFDIFVSVKGGGKTGQLEASRLSIARALAKVSESNKKILRSNGLLTCDSRRKERKKPGLKGARRGPQTSKR